MRKANIIISFILLGFSGFYGFLIARLPSRDLPNTLGAAFVPWVLAALLAGLSVVLLVCSFLDRNDKSKVILPFRDLSGIAVLILLIVCYIQLMSYLGFIIVTIVFLGILTWVAGTRNPLQIASFSILTTVAVYLLFHKFFSVQLPTGSLI